jgi:hypothetical protein
MLQNLIAEATRLLIQLAGLFVILTIYGSMWMGAQDENQNGWVIAAIWSFGIVTIANSVRLIFSAAGN